MDIIFILFFIFYQVIQILCLPLLIVFFLIRKFKKKPVFGNFQERLGFVPQINLNKLNNNIIWIHAVSVGEILSIQDLVNKIKQEKPNSLIYLTTGTLAGKNIAKKNINYDYLSFLPYDYLILILIAFKRIKPQYLIIVEAEIWPNLLLIAKLLNVKTFLINARISDRSKSKYFKFKFILKKLFNTFTLIFTQSEYDKIIFEQLGINSKKLKVMGNIKTLNVLTKKELTPKFNINNNYKILLVGSIHPGELDIYLELYKHLKRDPGSEAGMTQHIKLILAPRHFYWQKELITKINNLNEKYFLWDNNINLNHLNNYNLSENINNIFNNYNILLVCKLGELFNLYQFSNIYFLGGTFVNIGGHNLLEPAAWAIPSIVGPYHQNTKIIAQELEHSLGIFIAKDKNDLYLKSKNIILDSVMAQNMGKNSFDWLNQESNKVNNAIKDLISLFN